jgi:hypothetical protein
VSFVALNETSGYPISLDLIVHGSSSGTAYKVVIDGPEIGLIDTPGRQHAILDSLRAT